MQIKQWFRLDENPWMNGLRFAVLNAILAGFCAFSFVGTLFAVTMVELPFPYPLLFGLYILLFLGAWVWFGRRLPGNRRARLHAALVGVAPLLGLSLLGYLATVGMLLFNDVMSFFVGLLLATLVLCAALTCVAIVVLSGDGSEDTVLAT